MAGNDELKQEAAWFALAKSIADLARIQKRILKELRELHDEED